jgi:hypothetical protein
MKHDNSSTVQPTQRYAEIPTAAGHVWLVDFSLDGNTDGYTLWDLSPGASKTDAQIVGFVKRLAKHEPGPASWLLVHENALYMGRPVIGLWLKNR